MNRRVIGLVVAIVLAAVAATSIFLYTRGADDRAKEDFELAAVFVATGRIEAGTPAATAISQGLIERREYLANTVASGAIGALSQIEGQIAVATIFPGEQILTTKFGETVEIAQDLLEIPDGLEAVSIEIATVPGVAGYVKPGDHISIISLISASAPENVGPAEPVFDDEGNLVEQPPAADDGLRAQYLLQDVLVLQIGQRVVTRDENGTKTGYGIAESNGPYIFTLALDPVSIEKLIFANNQGTFWATLLPGDGRAPASTPGANSENLFQNLFQ